MTVHNYKSRQIHKTLNGLNPSSHFRARLSAILSLDPICAKFDKFLVHGQAHMGKMGPPTRAMTTIPLQPGGLRGENASHVAEPSALENPNCMEAMCLPWHLLQRFLEISDSHGWQINFVIFRCHWKIFNTAKFSRSWMTEAMYDSAHRSMTPKFVTPTALSCIDNSWRSTTLSPPKKLTSSTANLEWCHVHFISDSYSTFIRRVIGQSKNSMESFFNAKFDFKSTLNRDSTTSHHKHPVCQSPAGDAEKLTNVWSRYFGTNRIIENWHRCLWVMWRKRKNYFD